MSEIVKVDDLSIQYDRGTAPVIHGVSLSVRPGTSIGIVGESGSGKTTLARAIAGLLAPTAGKVLVDGVPWADVRRGSMLRRKVQMIFQDPYGSLNPSLTALQTVTEVFRAVRGYSRVRAKKAASELLDDVGIPAAAQARRPAGLSGGQCQRVGIARALACDPDVLIADEPTSALDVSVQAQILSLLTELRKTRNLALVLVSHDLGVVNAATEEILVMHRGEIIERGLTSQVFSRPSTEYTKVLLDSLPENWTD
jgi:ABC-type dipeptide/oligopeptide/nickel transport system ATPase subunit